MFLQNAGIFGIITIVGPEVQIIEVVQRNILQFAADERIHHFSIRYDFLGTFFSHAELLETHFERENTHVSTSFQNCKLFFYENTLFLVAKNEFVGDWSVAFFFTAVLKVYSLISNSHIHLH